MEKKTKLSNLQITLLVILTNIANTVFFVPGETISEIFQDSWIPIIISTVVMAVLSTYPLARMGMKFPGQTIIEYSEKIVGKIPGKVLGFILVAYLFQVHAWSFREFSELSILFMPETPLLVFFIMLAIVSTFAVFRGIEVIGRCAEFVFPLGLMSLIFLAIINLSDINYLFLSPVLESDPKLLLSSAQSSMSFMAIGVCLGILTPLAANTRDLTKLGMIMTGTTGLILTAFSAVVIAVLGPGLLSNANFPLLMLARYGQLKGFEVFVISVWFGWTFIRASVFGYVTCIGMAHLFGLKDYHALILPEVVLAIAYSINQYASFNELGYYFAKTPHILYIFPPVFPPLVMWLVSLIRERKILQAGCFVLITGLTAVFIFMIKMF